MYGGGLSSVLIGFCFDIAEKRVKTASSNTKLETYTRITTTLKLVQIIQLNI